MAKRLIKYASDLRKAVKRTSINHNSRNVMHKISSKDIEGQYSKYFSEQANIESHINLNDEFEIVEQEAQDMYEKWLMESD